MVVHSQQIREGLGTASFSYHNHRRLCWDADLNKGAERGLIWTQRELVLAEAGEYSKWQWNQIPVESCGFLKNETTDLSFLLHPLLTEPLASLDRRFQSWHQESFQGSIWGWFLRE